MQEKITPSLIRHLEPSDARFDVFDTVQKGLTLRIFPSGKKSFVYIYHLDGRKRRYTIGDADSVTVRQARDLVIIKAGEVAKGQDPQAEREQKRIQQKKAKSETVGGFYQNEYVPWLETERKSGKATAKRISSCFEWLFNKPMKSLTPFLLQGWIKKKLQSGISAHTINRDMIALKAMLSKAIEFGFLEEHPLSKLKKLKADDNSRVRYLSQEERNSLFKALSKREASKRNSRENFNMWRTKRNLPPLPELDSDFFVDHLEPIISIALNTGLRRGEIFNLEWRDIDFANNLLTVRAAATKGAKTRHIPLNAKARKVLSRWKKQTNGTGIVFPGKGNQRLNDISTSWKKLLLDAKITDFKFHDLRHDFATKTLKGGADIVTLSKLLGHTDLKMTLRYSHVTDEALADAVEKLQG